MTIYDDINRGFSRIDQDAVSTFNGEMLYPDNPNREVRARELSGDIKQLFHSFREEKSPIPEMLVLVVKEMEALYENNKQNPAADLKSLTVQYRELDLSINAFLKPLFGIDHITKALKEVSRAFDQIGIGDLERVEPAFDLMPFFPYETFKKGLEDGASRRAALKDYIKNAAQFRIELKVVELMDHKLSNTLMAIYSHLIQFQADKKSEKEITEALLSIISNAQRALDRDVTGDARSELARRDSYRGSWIREDR